MRGKLNDLYRHSNKGLVCYIAIPENPNKHPLEVQRAPLLQ